MSDDLRQAVERMKSSLGEVRVELRTTNQSVAALHQSVAALQQSVSSLESKFELFQIHVEEVFEMLIQHDTEQLRRIAAVEEHNAQLALQNERLLKQNDELLRQNADILRRLEVLERKAS